MTDSAALPLWLWTALAIAGCTVGLFIHLHFHPLRQVFSEAFDLIKNQPHLIAAAGLIILSNRWIQSDGFHPVLPFAGVADWTDWRALAPELLVSGLSQFSVLLHQLYPAWPVSLLLPFGLAAALWSLASKPYRCGLKHRPRSAELTGLALLAGLLTLWAVTELIPPDRAWPEALETILLGLKLLALALFTAASQVGLVLLVRLWLHPPATPSRSLILTAWWTLLGRWPLVLGLMGFNTVWIALHSWTHLAAPWSLATVLIETLLFFAPLPIVIAAAAPGCRFLAVGAQSLRLLGRCWLALLGLALTATALLALMQYTEMVLRALMQDWLLVQRLVEVAHSFALGLLENWLFLTAALMMLRQLTPSSDPLSTPSSSPL